MMVNGLRLPASFVRFFREGGSPLWYLKENVDAYGNPLETDLEPFGRMEWIEENTAQLPRYFAPPDPSRSRLPPEVREKAEQLRARDPSFLFDIADFSKIVQFGRSGSGEPFCFDFRENPTDPSVIHFDDSYSRWRRVAPDFPSFLALFEPLR